MRSLHAVHVSLEIRFAMEQVLAFDLNFLRQKLIRGYACSGMSVWWTVTVLHLSEKPILRAYLVFKLFVIFYFILCIGITI